MLAIMKDDGIQMDLFYFFHGIWKYWLLEMPNEEQLKRNHFKLRKDDATQLWLAKFISLNRSYY